MQDDTAAWLAQLRNPDGSRKARLLTAARGLYCGLFFSATARYPLGTNIYEREWDLLLVLDACRVDALREVAPEFEFTESVDDIWSVGSSSHEWLCKTFTQEYLDDIQETAYISTNPNTPPTFRDGVRPPRTYPAPLQRADWGVVEQSDFGLLRQIHRHDHEDKFETIAPDLVTDHAIHAGRTADMERMVVHYFQPHRPYIADAYAGDRAVTPVEDQPWTALREGTVEQSEVWELYLDNLRLVLQSVERLLENCDAKDVVITADHGDLFGELGIYGHPEGLVHPNLKKVPWVETTAVDKRTSEPDVDVARQETEVEVEEQLEQLGYI